jgi:WD40 repeat protein
VSLFSPDAQRILVGDQDVTLRVWDVESGELVLTLEHGERGIGACSVSPNGRLIVSVTNASTMCLWDATSGKLLRKRSAPDGDFVSAVSFDNRNVVVGGGEGASGRLGCHHRRSAVVGGALPESSHVVCDQSRWRPHRVWGLGWNPWCR